MATADKKSRLSGLFKSKKSQDYPPLNSQDEPKLSSSTNNASDSAYASSEGPSTRSDSNVVSMENHGQIKGVDSDRNLAVNKTTGDVLDEDTGEVVSTVTTTTTTTTTTIAKGGGKNKQTKVEVSTQPGQMQRQHHGGSNTSLAEAPGDNAQPAPAEQHQSSNHLRPEAAAPPPSIQQPTIPTRSPHRKSREYIEPSQQANFSYPARSNNTPRGDLPYNNDEQQQVGAPRPQGMYESLRTAAKAPAQEGTFESLKAAAIGIHGVGETLRGTLNTEVDTRFPRHDPNKALAANAKNQATLNRGNAEISRVSAPHGGGQQPPQQQQPSYGGLGGAGYDTVSPIQSSAESTWQRPTNDGGIKPDNDMNYMPSSFSPESSSAPKDERKGFRKLLKRRS